MKERLYIATISEEAAKLAAEYQIGLELDQYCMAENMDHHFLETDRNVKEMIAEAGNPPLFFHAPFNELHPGAIDYKIKQIAKERYEQAYVIASDYGIKNMVVHSGYLPHVYYKVWHHERSIEFWSEFMDGKPEDFTIYIENVLDDEPQMMVNLVRELNRPNIKLCFDVGHANCVSEVSPVDWVKTMAPYLGHLHLHNNEGEFDTHDPFGQGTIQMDSVLNVIERYCSPDISITIESRQGRESINWLHERGYI